VTLRVDLPPRGDVPRDYVGDLGPEGVAALLAPGRVGPMEVASRIVLPAMESNLGSREGRVTERLVRYYRERARGGVAWVTTENTSVHPSGRVTAMMLRIETDADGAAFAPLADAVHAEGSKLLVQLSHAGRQTLFDFAGGPPWAPSAIACPIMKDAPRAMTDDDVHELIRCFVAGAARAQAAGADGVELHMAHGYLLCGFLSPDQNRRDDAWGGDTDRRCAFPTAVVRGIREACGDGFAIVARISADEYVEGGIVPEEAVAIARRLVAAGVDALHVSACNYESMFWNIPTYFLPEAPFAPLARRIRSEVGVPVITVGRLHRPAVAARALLRGDADFVAMGRALIADPLLPRKLREGSAEDVRPCLACNRCIASINGARLECTVNPDVGFEGVDRGAAGRVVVVGGGVAGMAAALGAFEGGASVRLIERGRLGGQLDVAAMPPGKEPVAWYDAWLQRRLRASGVEVVEGRAAEAADLEGADLLVWAAGSRPTPRRWPGDAGLRHVALDDAMRDPALVGPRPVVVGAGAGGSECAHWLAHQGADVVLLEARRKIAHNLIPNLRFHLERELEEEGVRAFVQVKDMRIDGDDLWFRTRKEGEVLVVGVTALVDAAGRQPIDVPEALVAGFGGRVVRLGDAARPGSIFEALTDAATLWRSVEPPA
jgi:2,4-dienoyl-CoA reductase (NADPH2)